MASLLQTKEAYLDAGASQAVAFDSNVGLGSLVVFTSAHNSTAGTGAVAKTAGTATISAVQVDAVQQNGSISAFIKVWSFLVTGAGSLTVTFTADAGGSWSWLTMTEFSGSWDASRVEDTSTSGGSYYGSAPSSGNVTSVGAALLFGATMFYVSTGYATSTPDAAWTELGEEGSVDHMTGAVAYRTVATGTTDSADWTISTALDCATVAIAYKEATFAVVQSVATVGDGVTGTQVTLAVNNIVAGHLLCVWVKGEGGAATPTNVAISDGTSSFAVRSVNARGTAQPWGCFGYLLSANAGNKTITASWTTSQGFCRLRVVEVAYTGNIAFDIDNSTADGDTANLATGTITTTAADSFVVAADGEYSGVSPSSPLIGGAAADGSISGTGNDAHCMMWWKKFASIQTNIAGSATSNAGDWVASIIAFKELTIFDFPSMTLSAQRNTLLRM